MVKGINQMFKNYINGLHLKTMLMQTLLDSNTFSICNQPNFSFKHHYSFEGWCFFYNFY